MLRSAFGLPAPQARSTGHTSCSVLRLFGWRSTARRATTASALEIVVLPLDDGTELAIHAMKARTQYFDLLP